MKRWTVAVGLVGLLSMGFVGDRWPDPDSSGAGGGGAGNGGAGEVVTGEWYGQNLATADFTSGDVLSHVTNSAAVAYTIALRHSQTSIAATTVGQTITVQRFACSIANDTGTGTANFNLVVYEEGTDTTPETIATIGFNLATEMNAIKATTTAAAITSTAPYFFAVMASDGGSVSVTGSTMRVICQAVWSRS